MTLNKTFSLEGQEYVKEIIIPNGFTKIGELGLSDCVLLTKVIIPKSIVEIDTCALCISF